jgi:hypothetical protein
MDLQWRNQQWSLQGRCPPPLARSSAAYRYGGCGTHEVVLYYDLTRHLIHGCWEQFQREPQMLAAIGVARLTRLRDDWLVTPQPQDLHGKTPQRTIDDERRRIPQVISNEDALVDHDCPLCAMLVNLPGPIFWHLDGGHMDDDFAFSFCRTRQEWIEERRAWEDFRRSREESEEDAGRGSPVSGTSNRRSAPNSCMPAQVLLQEFESQLAELFAACRDSNDGERWIAQLQREFENLSVVVRERAAAIISGVVGKFEDTLADLADQKPSIATSCTELIERLHQMDARLDANDG